MICNAVFPNAAWPATLERLRSPLSPPGGQQYTIAPVGDGFYRIRPRHSGKCLGVSQSRQDNGTEVIQWDCVDVYDQEFKLD